jgi:hypothetical protein
MLRLFRFLPAAQKQEFLQQVTGGPRETAGLGWMPMPTAGCTRKSLKEMAGAAKLTAPCVVK